MSTMSRGALEKMSTTETAVFNRKQWLRDLMDQKGLTREDIAGWLGKTTRQISRYRSDNEKDARYAPSDAEVALIAKRSGVDMPGDIIVDMSTGHKEKGAAALKEIDRVVDYELTDEEGNVRFRVTFVIEHAGTRSHQVRTPTA